MNDASECSVLATGAAWSSARAPTIILRRVLGVRESNPHLRRDEPTLCLFEPTLRNVVRPSGTSGARHTWSDERGTRAQGDPRSEGSLRCAARRERVHTKNAFLRSLRGRRSSTGRRPSAHVRNLQLLSASLMPRPFERIRRSVRSHEHAIQLARECLPGMSSST